MLRSILIRQTFVWIDLALAVIFIGTAGLVIYTLLQPTTVTLSDQLAGLELETATPAQLAKVGPRFDYDGLIKSGLFGDAGSDVPPPPPPPPPVEEGPVTETELNLRLIGTTDLTDERFESAVIQEGDQQTTAAVYKVGDKIMDNVTLVEVGDREAFTLNEIGGKSARERLDMDETEGEDGKMASGPPPPPAAPAEPAGAVQRISLNREELMQELMTDYSKIASMVKPELARDESGNVIGVTADNIGQVPMARKLGLGDGDILQTVNNEQIDSEQKIYEVIQKFQNANSIRIGVMSGGKPKVITYRLN
jgi:general secretion pathway protein C